MKPIARFKPVTDHKSNTPSTGKLGTFAGVFTPSVLTILGIILFLRLGYVVGSAGLKNALIMIGLANLISVLTSVSLSAVATNLKVKGGGDYYLISRTLGVEFGGAIGIVLFMAQAVSIAFYCIGFGEALTAMLPQNAYLHSRIIAALAVSFLFIFAWMGADWATRFQYVVMGLLAAALLSFFAGGLTRWDSAVLAANWLAPGAGPGFWVLFAIFFPAVTGFTQGVSMSGDLKDPGKSLPLGTFLAVGISILVYFAVAVIIAGVLPGDILIQDYGAMKRAASLGFLIDAGVIAATLSSAMASFLGAPRILQSLASDRIFPFLLPFAKGAGPSLNPRRGVLLSAGIAFVTIALGNLNLIAPIVSMFFLISYGLLNYATFFEARTASPSFRPRFRWFDYRLSLLGGLACLGAMLAIDLAAGTVAICVIFAVYQYLKRTAGPARWADSRRSYHLQQVREHLLAAAAEPEHDRDWRPYLLAFSNDPHRREKLLRFAAWLEGGSGLTTAVRILEGEGPHMLKLQTETLQDLQKDIAGHALSAFALVVSAPNLEIGVREILQAFGIGPLKANSIILNWIEQDSASFIVGQQRFGRNLRTAFRLGYNIVMLDAKQEPWRNLKDLPAEKRRIDVWYWDDATSRLMLLLAHLMTRSEAWEGSKIRVLAAQYERQSEEADADFAKILDDFRIEAEPRIIAQASAESLAAESSEATLVFFPFRLRGDRLVDPFGGPLQDLLARLPVAAMSLAAKDIDLDAQPEEGAAAERAEILDALTDAGKKARKAEKKAAESAMQAQEKSQEAEQAAADGNDPEAAAQKKAEAEAASKVAEDAARRAAKALAKEKDAAREAEAKGVAPAVEEQKQDSPENP